jgi:hypothetical protein
MAHCKKCHRRLAKGEKRSDHQCDTVRLDNGAIVHKSAVDTGGYLAGAIDNGEVKVVERAIPKPLKSITDSFRKKENS